MNCRICGNSDDNKVLQVREMMFGFRDQFSYLECSACGCLQIVQIPQDMSKYYPLDYDPWRRRSARHPIERFATTQRDRYAVFGTGLVGKLLSTRYPNRFLHILAQANPDCNSTILDVGCGSGAFLRDLRALGFRKLTGIDPYTQAETSDGNITILKKTILDLPDSDRFDVIFFNHSLEHIWDQHDTLLRACHLLNPAGVCVVRMPIKTETIWNLYGTDWLQLDAPRHFCVHTLSSFRHLSQKASFAITNVLFDSDEHQFWGSEQYRRDIPLQADNSYGVDPKRSIFSHQQIEGFRDKARELNRTEEGDQAAFFLAVKQ